MDRWISMAEKEKIGRYVESFRQLAERFHPTPEQREDLSEEDLQEIFETAREKICERCGRRNSCWGKDAERTFRQVYRLLQAVEEGDGSSAAEQDFCRYCVKGRSFRKELESGFSRARLNLLWSNRMMESRAAVARQLSETAQILEEIACTVYEAETPFRDLERKLKLQLGRRRVLVRDAGLLRDGAGHPEILLTLSSWGASVPVREIAQVISGVYHRPMAAERDSRMTVGKEPCALRFVEETRYYMLMGHAMEACGGQPVSGDNFTLMNGNHGQAVMAICDGMGCGRQANEESQSVIELLEQFLETGFSMETAVRMLHSSVVLQGEGRACSTLDLCGIDLYRGVCRILKIGASTTFLRRGLAVEAVASHNPPMGALPAPGVERWEVQLEDGDMIFLISDGVLDALPEREAEELMKYFIRELTTDNPAQSARILMDQALEFCQDGVQDDMTILAGGFWKKEFDNSI